MAESRSGVCELEKEPGIEFPGDGSDDSSMGLGDWLDESMSSSEDLSVDSRSDGGDSSEHVSEADNNVSDFIILNYFHGKQKHNVNVLTLLLLLPKSVDGHRQR
jgi:hypothetical protein